MLGMVNRLNTGIGLLIRTGDMGSAVEVAEQSRGMKTMSSVKKRCEGCKVSLGFLSHSRLAWGKL